MQKRIFSIDFTRGVVMTIMALDHVRDLLHTSSITSSPTDLSTTSPVLFFTRWITYFCAPIFVFLAGTSVFLAASRSTNLRERRIFLFKRGLFLVVAEFTVVNLGVFFDAGFHLLMFEVIATIGFGFIILSALMSLSSRNLLIIGLAILLLHDAVIFIPAKPGSFVMTYITPFFGPAAIPVLGRVFFMAYPPVPWLGIMLVGYGTGSLFLKSSDIRQAWFLRLGIGCLLLFVLVRGLNIYGDPAPWSAQKNGIFTFLSFINVTKYPPSLSFAMVTLGVMFLILLAGEKATKRWAEVPRTYGQAALFYFVVHFYLIHLILLAVLFLQGYSWADLSFAGGTFGRAKAHSGGLPLWAVYMVWIAVVTVMYRPCKWFTNYRRTHKQAWLKYV